MKRLCILLLTLALLLTCSLPALADMGLPSIDPYFAVVRPGGAHVTYDEWDNYGNHTSTSIDLPAGTRLYVRDDYGGQFGAYYSPEGYYDKFRTANEVTDITAGKLVWGDSSRIIAATETLAPDSGNKIEAPVKATVDSSDGLILRYGPASTYAAKTLLPDKTTISYEYTCSDGKRNWGYVDYNGSKGWVCLSFVQTAPEKTEVPEENIDTPPQQETDEPAETAPEEEKQYKHIINQLIILLLCILCVAALAIAAILILRNMKRRKQAAIEEQEKAPEEKFPRE